MPLESLPDDIASLEDLWPLPTDIYTQGDDHLRYIKYMLQTQFPGANGQGFDEPIIATEAEINYLSGLTSAIQTQLDAIESDQDSLGGSLSSEYGLRCLFGQASPPTGWVQITDYDDYQMRVVNTAGAGTGGTDSPFTYDWAHTHTTSGVSISTAQMPRHTHGIQTCSDSNTVVVNSSDKRVSTGLGADKYSTYNVQMALTGNGDPHTHGDVAANTSQFRPKYLNIILAENQTGYDSNTYYGYAMNLGPTRYWRMDDV